MQTVEVIAIGKELLTGRVLDTNSNWLAKRITILGLSVKRMTTVDDDRDAIVTELERAISNRAGFIFTTGGLGPTFDDKTLEAIGTALGKRMVINHDALELIRSRYGDLHERGFVDDPAMTPERQKMAILPVGSTILSNRIGVAPGVVMHFREHTITALPGVPAEMRTIFDDHLADRIKEIAGGGVFLETKIQTPLGDESKLAVVIEKVMTEVPGVYLKTRPKNFGEDVKIEVVLTARGDDEGQASALLQKAASSVKEALSGSDRTSETIEP